jgi:hypothetical protein
MTEAARLPGPVIWTLAGMAVSIAGLLLPVMMIGAQAIDFSHDLPVIAAVMVCLYGQSSCAVSADATRLKIAVLMPVVLALAVGGAAYGLYTDWQPGLLQTVYAAKLAVATGPRLTALQQAAAHWLSPLAQAADLAMMVLTAGFVVSGFVVFRARVARRRSLKP